MRLPFSALRDKARRFEEILAVTGEGSAVPTDRILETYLEKWNEVQHAVVGGSTYRLDDAASVGGSSNTYTGNNYKSYDAATLELALKYEGEADWGCQIASNVIDVRSAFVIGQGVVVRPKDDKIPATRELAFLQEFIKANDLDEETPQDWCIEAEIEGKFLCQLSVVPGAGRSGDKIAASHLAWTDKRYTVSTAPGNTKQYTKAAWKAPGTGAEVALAPPNFVFKRFGGRSINPNTAKSKVAKVLSSLEAYDKALRDWRQINVLHTPTPTIEAETEDQARLIHTRLTARSDGKPNWKIGRLLVIGGAKYRLVGLPPGSLDSIEKEIFTHVKAISGGTGVPVHFLGMPDLMSNRAVAENLMELIVAATSRDRKVWKGFYDELFRKALALANEELGTGFNLDVIEVAIPAVSLVKMQELATVWLPLFLAGAVSLETLLDHVPEIDAAKEKVRIREAAAEVVELRGPSMLSDEEDAV